MAFIETTVRIFIEAETTEGQDLARNAALQSLSTSKGLEAFESRKGNGGIVKTSDQRTAVWGVEFVAHRRTE